MSHTLTNTEINWSAIINKNKCNLLWTCQKILNCPKRAEDALQDAFIRLSQLAPEQSIEIKRPERYLFQVVRNISIDHKRKLTKEDGYLSELTPQFEIADCADGPEQILDEHNLLNAIENSLAKLPRRTREVFEIYRHGDLTQKEISKKYGISPTLVNFLIKDAIKSCRHDLHKIN
ncbi:MAG: RNA polymerase sigma factor (sigma-70 family) [Paraglaciecola sp.]|jgi:RNA polymerase sigma-70 factor (ECF subfamily)